MSDDTLTRLVRRLLRSDAQLYGEARREGAPAQAPTAARIVIELSRPEVEALKKSARHGWVPPYAWKSHARFLLRERLRQRMEELEEDGHAVGSLPRSWRSEL